jgi:hypothetical protein
MIQDNRKFRNDHEIWQQMRLFRSRVRNEVERANKLHGHNRDLIDGTGTDDLRLMRDQTQVLTDKAMREGKCTWKDILLEEVFEAVAETDPDLLLKELTQCAAVIENWVENIYQKRIAGL